MCLSALNAGVQTFLLLFLTCSYAVPQVSKWIFLCALIGLTTI